MAANKENANQPPVNIVFQGGGVRGLAHVGVLEELASRARLVRFGGVSAGSIVAALLAAGATVDELRTILQETDFQKLLVRVGSGNAKLSWLNRMGLRIALGRVGVEESHIDLVESSLPGLLHDGWGIYDGAAVEDWLNARLLPLVKREKAKKGVIFEGTCKFRDLPHQLAIATTDLRGSALKVYRGGGDPNKLEIDAARSELDASEMLVAKVVRQSASIPFFFNTHDMECDGGVLRNFPIELFADELEVTVGVRLVQSSGRDDGVKSVKAFVARLVDTVLSAHDTAAVRRVGSHVSVISVDTGPIGTVDFDLSSEDKEGLRKAGHSAVATWLINGGERFLSSASAAEQLDWSTAEWVTQQLKGREMEELGALKAEELEALAARISALAQPAILQLGPRLGKHGQRLALALGTVGYGFVFQRTKEQRSRAAEGVPYLQTALTIAPDESQIQRQLGYAMAEWAHTLNPNDLNRKPMLSAAVTLLRSSLTAKDARRSKCHHGLGWTFDEMGLLPMAIEHYRSALAAVDDELGKKMLSSEERVKTVHRVAYNLACVHSKLNETHAALGYLKSLPAEELEGASEDRDLDNVRRVLWGAEADPSLVADRDLEPVRRLLGKKPIIP